MLNPTQINWQKVNNLIPAIIQDHQTKQVLMLGYMNKEALAKTQETKKVTFFSRTKNRLWTKGETSGNFLELKEIQLDCDQDTLLIQAKPQGPTCHEGTTSCFKGSAQTEGSAIEHLYSLIEKRAKTLPENSYTTELLKEGTNKICTKIAEESGEVIKAATKETKQRLIEESIDLIYHLFVLLASEETTWPELEKEIQSRRK